MTSRKVIESNRELAQWYDEKYKEKEWPWWASRDDIERHLSHIFNVTSSLGAQRILDIGCGSGDFLKVLWDSYHPQCIGIDFSAEACKFSAEQCPWATIIKGGVSSSLAWLQPHIFDWVVSIGTVEHFVDEEACYRSLRRVLKPNGHWYFYVPNELYTLEDQPNERTFTDEGWKEHLSKQGLRTEGSERLRDNTAFWGVPW